MSPTISFTNATGTFTYEETATTSPPTDPPRRAAIGAHLPIIFRVVGPDRATEVDDLIAIDPDIDLAIRSLRPRGR